MTTELSIYVPVGMLGYGFPESSLRAALQFDLDLIGVDAGSVDPGPYYLGSGRSFTSRSMVSRDLDLLIAASRSKGIPLVIGSAGGAGGAPHLAWALEIVREICLKRDAHLRVAVIEAEQDREYLRSKLANGQIHDFEAGRELRQEDIDMCSHLVAQMGPEPIIAALAGGADLVLAGRAFDAAIAASLPLMRGFDEALAIHMGKILECGSLVAIPREHDGVIGRLREDHFLIEPADPDKRSTVDVVSAHMLYERADPFHLQMPGGTLDLTDAAFEQAASRTVRVTGGRFLAADRYMIKLEGSARVGYRSVCFAGVRDPYLIREINDVTRRVVLKIRRDLGSIVPPSSYKILFRLYGRDGVMNGLEPDAAVAPRELGVLIDVVGDTQETADAICALARSATLHMGYEGRLANAGNLAFPFSPAEFAAPEVYEFRVYHLMEVDDPCQPFPIQWIET
jgi:acyclic terpene utilization AtuA family protein